MSSDQRPQSPFEILERQRVHDGFLKLDRYKLRQRLFQGGLTPELDREVVVAREAVAVLCFDPQRDEIVLIEQARLPAAIVGFDPVQVEIVAGVMDPGEGPEDVARREVLEETGLQVIGALEPIIHMITTPGHSTEHIHLFCARVDAAKAGGIWGVEEEHEDIRILVVSVADFFQRLQSRQVTNSFSLVTGFWFMLNYDRLKSLWQKAP